MPFDANRYALGRLAAASKPLPVGLIALLAQRALGPVLAARIAGMLEPSRAVDVATKLPTVFLTDAAPHIDPRCASALIAAIPPARIAEVARELARRGEFATIGRLVGDLGTEATAAALDAMGATTAVRDGEARQPRRRLARVLAPAVLVALVAAISVVVTTPFEDAATPSNPAMSSHALARRVTPYWTVRSGDTFTQIAEKTRLTIGELEAFQPDHRPASARPRAAP